LKDNCPATTGTPALEVNVLTYNLFWWNLFGIRHGENGRAGRKIADTSLPEEYDLMGFQECEDPDWLMWDAHRYGLSGEYGVIRSRSRALCTMYRKSRWTLLDSGREDVGEDGSEQYFGKRSAQWGRFLHRDGLTVFFVNHHGPLPVSSGGGCKGSAVSYNILRVIAENANGGDLVIAVGDFNAQPGSSRIDAMDKHMHRAFTGTAIGGVDYIFSNCEKEKVYADNLGSGGSDHDALNAVFSVR